LLLIDFEATLSNAVDFETTVSNAALKNSDLYIQNLERLSLQALMPEVQMPERGPAQTARSRSNAGRTARGNPRTTVANELVTSS